MIRNTFILLLLCSNIYAQIDTSKIKIAEISTCEYTYKETSDCDFIGDNEVVDTTNVILFDEITENSCLYIETEDALLNKFLNDSITKCKKNLNLSKKNTFNYYRCILDKAFENYSSQKLNYFSDNYISITNFEDKEACCGANGSSHYINPITYDFTKRKELLLKDILNSQTDTLVYNIIIEVFKIEKPNLSGDFWEINNPFLIRFVSTVDYSFELHNDKIVVYLAFNWGYGGGDEAIIIPFEKYSYLFKKEFLKSMEK